MPGMEAAITTLRERVDGPDVMAASRAAQNSLIGFPETRQQTLTLRVMGLAYLPFLSMFVMIMQTSSR